MKIVAGILFSFLVLLGLGLATHASRSEPPQQVAPGGKSSEQAGGELIASSGRPKAVVGETLYNFGVMEPNEKGSHMFEVRNEGTAPLKVEKGSSTCKCTLANVIGNAIAPGTAGLVELRWETGPKLEYFSHGATIHTDDPDQEVIHFYVEGNILRKVGTVPAALEFGNVAPDEEATGELVLYSQVSEFLQITNIDATLEGARWQVIPVPKQEIVDPDTLCAYRILVTLPGALSTGHFTESLQLHVRTSDTPVAEQVLEIPLVGSVMRRLAVYGPDISLDGLVDLGKVAVGQEVRAHYILKVRDPEKRLNVTGVVSEPDFVSVQISPRPAVPPAQDNNDLYNLTLEVPPTARPGSWTGTRPGRILIKFDHPRICELELSLKLLVHDLP